MGNLVYLLLIPLLIEQLFYHFQGSYPYKYGITLRKIEDKFKIDPEVEKVVSNRLLIKINNRNKERYFSFKYPLGVIGPLLFIGTSKVSRGIVPDDENRTLFIKIGPVTFVYFISIILISLLVISREGIVSALLFISILYLFFNAFMSALEKGYTAYIKGKADIRYSKIKVE